MAPKKEPTERELLEEISHKLDLLMGAIAVQGKEPKVQIGILTALGLSGREIGTLLAKKPDAIRKTRSRAKR